MIRSKCPGCGKNWKLPDEAAGQEVRCAKCGENLHSEQAITDSSGSKPALSDGPAFGAGRGDQSSGVFVPGSVHEPPPVTNNVAEENAAIETGNTVVAWAAGVGAALLAGVIWAGVTYATGYEFGYAAIAIGAVVGLIVAQLSGTRSVAQGVGAACLAAGSIGMGKLVIATWALPAIIASGMPSPAEADVYDLWVYDYAVKQLHEDGVIGDELFEAALEGDLYFDEAVWIEEQVVAWEERNGQPQPITMAKGEIAGLTLGERVTSVLSAFDLLWIGLACSAAFRLNAANDF